MEDYNEELTELVESLIRTGRERRLVGLQKNAITKIELHCCMISFVLQIIEQIETPT